VGYHERATRFSGRKFADGERTMKSSDCNDKAQPQSLADAQTADHSVQLALLAAIVASSDDAIVSKTLDGLILSWNEGATRIFGYQASEVIGKPITIIIPPELHDEERRILHRVRHGERVDHFDTIRVTKDGRRIAISLTVSPVRDSKGTIVGASKVARDVSERKAAEQALRESEQRLRASEEALQDADRRKDEFLALLAHELRNPLAPIRYALAANKKEGRAPEQQKRAEEVIERQVTHMSRLLDDLLDVSRITRGRRRALSAGVFQYFDQRRKIHGSGWTHSAAGNAAGRRAGSRHKR
jgi:PAS domain S-box-containing protein